MVYSIKHLEDDKILVNEEIIVTITDDGCLELECNNGIMTEQELDEMGKYILNLIESYILNTTSSIEE